MRADSLTFDQRLDPGGGEGGFLDAKAWIDQHQPFRKQFGKMRGVAIGARGADPHGLGDIVDPHENQIEPPRADAAPFKIARETLAQDADDALQIVRITKRFRGTSGGTIEISTSAAEPSA
jgi:hypothetical protein